MKFIFLLSEKNENWQIIIQDLKVGDTSNENLEAGDLIKLI